jgi:hexosaminidase
MRKLLICFLIPILSLGQVQDQELSLMPWPQSVEKGTGKYLIQADFSIAVAPAASQRTTVNTTRFLRQLSNRSGVFMDHGFAFEASMRPEADVIISYNRVGKLDINQDESYSLHVSSEGIEIDAPTDIGVIYALETLLQLLSHDGKSFYFPEVTITDAPRFTWRGLMIDAARHFQPVDVIKRNLDAMASMKMNVLHWHLTDDQGFRVESFTHPRLHELASDGQYYTQNQIRDIVKYASDRGIRVVPEFDVPGHATAILTAYPEIGSKKMTYELERFAGIFDPTIDPTNERSYEILGELFEEMAGLFPDRYFHIGGDENAGKHWDENQQIQAFMKERGFKTNHELQTYFNIRLEKMLQKHGKAVMGWEEIMTKNMPTTALIHSWRGVNEGVPPGKSLADAAKRGYNTILSNGYYIDLMQPVKEHYLVDPMPSGFGLSSEEKARILGGEATMWGELVTPLTIDSRIWPRTAAIAERFWSSAEVRDLESMYRRLDIVSHQLEALGITHKRNRDVILRNITGNQDIHVLVALTRVYEPLKIYTRNKGGTEYRSYSPFTLLADACTADAPDGRRFNTIASRFLKDPGGDNRASIAAYLERWKLLEDQFKALNKNPLLNNIEPAVSKLSRFSGRLLSLMHASAVSKAEFQELDAMLSALKLPVEDVELTVSNSFAELLNYYKRVHQLE